MPSNRKSNQCVILEIASLVLVPSLSVSYFPNQSPGFPPIFDGGFPLNMSKPVQVSYQLLSRVRACTPAQFRKHDRGMPDNVRPPDYLQGIFVQPKLPMSDIDVRIEDSKMHVLWTFHATWFQKLTTVLHKLPEFLHFRDPFQRRADGLGSGLGP